MVRIAATVMLLAALIAPAWGQGTVLPSIGYVLPAGGQRGTTVEVWVGGSRLMGASRAQISGEGVSARVVKAYPFARPLDREEREAIVLAVQAATRKLQGAPPPPGATEPSADLPEHPLLDRLNDPTMEDIQRIVYEFLTPKPRQQPQATTAETVVLEVTIAPDAPPGLRELRIAGELGLSNPLPFEVGLWPETVELEPNDPDRALGADSLSVPFVVNGQIEPGDVDRFAFQARSGQRLVIDMAARRLVPYLADAVPGWFEGMVTLYGPSGTEVGYADHFRFDPDPVLLYETPADGLYTLEVRDSIYRGRKDFVYRISVAEQPFVLSVYPLGGRAGAAAHASLTGWNLPAGGVRLDTSLPPGSTGVVTSIDGTWLPRPIRYQVGASDESHEDEPNDDLASAQEIALPRTVNGLIDRRGDVDVYRITGEKGTRLCVEVTARSLGSQLDSFVQVTDATGRVIASNDDRPSAMVGLQTHAADSYLELTLDDSGPYFVHIADAQQQGGEACAYRLSISPPQPGFSLYTWPSSISLRAGQHAPLKVRVERHGGFDGEIGLGLVEAPPDFALMGGTIPAGCSEIVCTLAGPPEPLPGPVLLMIEGTAEADGLTIQSRAIPADEWEQAFIYKHLIPAEEFLALVQPVPPWAPRFRLVRRAPLELRPGEAAEVRVLTGLGQLPKELRFTLADPPEGISLSGPAPEQGAMTLSFAVDADATDLVGRAGNLVVEVSRDFTARNADGAGAQGRREVTIGVLPAIPFVVVP